MSDHDLAKQLASGNTWHRDTAARLLFERQDDSALRSIGGIARRSRSALSRMHGLYVLAWLDALFAVDLFVAADDRNPRVWEHALKLSERHSASDKVLQRNLISLVNDTDQRTVH